MQFFENTSKYNLDIVFNTLLSRMIEDKVLSTKFEEAGALGLNI